MPHTSLKDDTYDGYFIPKGTSVISNVWYELDFSGRPDALSVNDPLKSDCARGISRNTKYYSDPSTFDPERYLKPVPEPDPRQFAFGYGRRICPGNELAFEFTWLMAASILWAFCLEGADDDNPLLRDDINRFSHGTVRWVPRYV